ncbi:MAG: putative phosphotransacetylase [Clostridia bacterium]|nr:putative phosphotransacetylase [Clostridia bacterium]
MDNFLLEVPVGVSGRHVHLSKEHLNILFGNDYELTPIKDLGQPGQYAAKETVTIIGPKGILEKVRIIGPTRSASQVELSKTDCFKVGVNPPVRDSGVHEGSPGCILVGPEGVVKLEKGVIIASRHIHMLPEDAEKYGLKDKDMVKVKVDNERGLVFENVLVRVSTTSGLEFHIDTDEANACLLKTNDSVKVLR